MPFMLDCKDTGQDNVGELVRSYFVSRKWRPVHTKNDNYMVCYNVLLNTSAHCSYAIGRFKMLKLFKLGLILIVVNVYICIS